jgi:hypothetical protein
MQNLSIPNKYNFMFLYKLGFAANDIEDVTESVVT